MDQNTHGEKDFSHSVGELVASKKEEILLAWADSDQAESAARSTGEDAKEIGRDFLSATISGNAAGAAETFRGVGADVLAKSFQSLKRTASRVLDGFADRETVCRLFDDALIELLSAHSICANNLTKEYRKAVDLSAIVSIADLR